MSGGPARPDCEPALRVIAAARPGSVRWHAAANSAGGLPALLTLGPAALRNLGLDPEATEKLRNPDRERLAHWRDWLAQPGHGLVALGSEDYPPALAELPGAPLALWTSGANVGLLRGPQLAIVGSRNPTAGGVHTARRFAEALGSAGLTITSGLAAGIDAAAHTGAIGTVGCTIAVLGSGIDTIYPACNGELAARIRESGLIVSEYGPGTPTQSHQFPIRNRIIAGLSLGTLVVEAARRSGALITARLAGEFGRSVFAVPGPIRSALSKGCHRLLRSGAGLVEDVRDILLELGPKLATALAESDRAEDSPASPDTSRAQTALLAKLDFVPVTVGELLSVTGLTAAELSSMLLHLELEGTIEALPDGRYCRRT